MQKDYTFLFSEIFDLIQAKNMFSNQTLAETRELTDEIFKTIRTRIDGEISRLEDKDTMYDSVKQRIAGMKIVKDLFK